MKVSSALVGCAQYQRYSLIWSDADVMGRSFREWIDMCGNAFGSADSTKLPEVDAEVERTVEGNESSDSVGV